MIIEDHVALGKMAKFLCGFIILHKILEFPRQIDSQPSC